MNFNVFAYMLLSLIVLHGCSENSTSTENNIKKELINSNPDSSEDPLLKYNLPTKKINTSIIAQNKKNSPINLFLKKSKGPTGKSKITLSDHAGNEIAYHQDSIALLLSNPRQFRTIRIHADKDLPYGVIRHFQSLLELNNLLKVGYVNASGQIFTRRLRQITGTNPPPPPPMGNNAKKVSLFNEKTIALLDSYSISVNENPTFMKGTLPKMKRKVLELDVKNETDLAELQTKLANYSKEVPAQNMITSLMLDDFSTYEQYFNVHSTITEFYYQKRDDYCLKTYGVRFLSANKDQQKDARSKHPVIISLGM